MIYLVVILGVLFVTKTVSASSNYDFLFKKYGDQYDVDWKRLKAIAIVESAAGLAPSVLRGIENPLDIDGSKSSDGKSWGIMQFTIPTAQDFDSSATAVKLNNPEYSIKLASQFLKYLATIFPESKYGARSIEYIVKSYNQGQGNTLKEISSGTGYANAYWVKYKSAYSIIDGI